MKESTDNSIPICFCKNLSRKDLEAAIREGACTIAQLRERTGATSKCYGCLADIEDMLYLQKQLDGPPTGGLRGLTSVVPGVRTLRRRARLAVKGLRRELAWRREPWKLGTWVVEQENLHSRLVMCNLECPGEHRAFNPFRLKIDFYDSGGKLAGSVHRVLGLNQTLVLETRDLLAELGLSAPAHGMLEVSYTNRYVRSGRCYTQWYNDVSLTASHERRFRSIFPARLHGYEAVHRIIATDEAETYPIVVNCRAPRFTTHACLAAPDGRVLRSRAIAIPGMGTLFRPVTELFPNARDFLNGEEGVLYFDTVGPLMTYYLIHHRRSGGWQGQHLE
jgi:bacterioferritin-associated ferredoxin